MHNRSIEFAKKFHVPIHVRSSLSDAPGSVIAATADATAQSVSGAALLKDEARVSLLGVPDVPGTSLEFFSRIADRNVSVDMIVQNVGQQGKADISFTIPSNELRVTLDAVAEAREIVGVDEVTHDERTSKISVVGLGMARQTGVADRMFRALADAGVNIQMITTSEIKISVLVERNSAQNALRAVHKVFELEKQPEFAGSDNQPVNETTPTNAADVVDRLRGVDMEELTIHDVQLDPKQGRITMNGVPDSPGVAAHVFEEVAAAGIFVDMIVQSYTGRPDGARLSFTVPQNKLAESVAVTNRLAESFNCGGVSSSPSIAKLSVSGVGLRSHTGVAIRMFGALADANINVQMINTSEVRVNVVVDGNQGEQALEKLQAAFADVMR